MLGYDRHRVYDREELSKCKDSHMIASGNLARIDPLAVKDFCERYGYPWFSYGEPYTSGILCRVPNDIWNTMRESFKY